MNRNRIALYIASFIALCLMNVANAGTPLWSFVPLTATKLTVLPGSTATVQYNVTNHSKKSHALVMQPITGVTQTTAGGVCSNPFTLGYEQSCVLSLSINGSKLTGNTAGGPHVCQQGSQLQCYQPSLADSLDITLNTSPSATMLSASLSNLTLGINGTARLITITNVGSFAATGLSINFPTWPSGTSAITTCGSVLNTGQSCTITITPGPNATSNCNAGTGSAPVAGVITVSASNASGVTTNVIVIANGCILQQGFVFSIDDTPPISASVGATIAALEDNSIGIQWYNGSYFATFADSLVNGLSNTATIITAQGAGSYAASLCATYTIDSDGNTPCTTGTCYTNWYLPAICQMGSAGPSCPIGVGNIVDNLAPLLDVSCMGSACISGIYWSSTEGPFSPTVTAWIEVFASGGGSGGATADKSFALKTRCIREIV